MPMVTVFFWNKGGPDHKGFNIKKYYHPKCWLEQGLDYLKMNPYIPYRRKPKLELTPEQSQQRYKLLRRKASIEQRRRRLDGNNPDRWLSEALLDVQITDLMIEIAPLGGIPDKWLKHHT